MLSQPFFITRLLPWKKVIAVIVKEKVKGV